MQAINKLLNLDHIFFTVVNGGTPMNNAEMPMQFAKNVPNIFPLTAARSMYEPYNPLKFAQFSSYYDQMRSAVKYFVQQRHVSHICAMYQDSGLRAGCLRRDSGGSEGPEPDDRSYNGA